MFSSLGSQYRRIAELTAIVKKYSPLLFAAVLAIAAVQKYLLLSRTDGGGELQSTYVPKTLMLLRGENPYSTEPWAAPYPPFLFMVLAGIVWLTSWSSALGQDQVAVAAWNIRLAGLLADLLVGVLIFLALRARNMQGLPSLVPPAIFLLLPSVALSNYYWFHGDVFGYLILAGSILAFARGRMLVGLSLLSMAVIFKLHPILSVSLLLVWIVRRQGLLRTVPVIVSSLAILLVGLVGPLLLPGYLNTVVGFNLSYGSGNGTASFTLMNLFNGVLPAAFGVTLSPVLVNEIWVAATIGLFAIALGLVLIHGRSLEPVDVVLLGLLAWLIPLRTLYPYYLVWAFIPFLVKCSIQQLVVLGALFEAATTLAVWSWNIPPNPFPEMSSAYGYFITSLAFAAWSILAACFLVRGVRNPILSTPTTSMEVLKR